MEFLPKLAEQGVMAILLAISVSANYFFIKMIINSYEKRLQETRDARDNTMQVLSGIKTTTDLTLDIIKGLVGRGS